MMLCQQKCSHCGDWSKKGVAHTHRVCGWGCRSRLITRWCRMTARVLRRTEVQMCVSPSITRSACLQQLQSILGARGGGGQLPPPPPPLHSPRSLSLSPDWLLLCPADCPLSETEGERGRGWWRLQRWGELPFSLSLSTVSSSVIFSSPLPNTSIVLPLSFVSAVIVFKKEDGGGGDMLAFSRRWCFSAVIVFFCSIFHPSGQIICGFYHERQRGWGRRTYWRWRGARLMEGGEKMADDWWRMESGEK